LNTAEGRLPSTPTYEKSNQETTHNCFAAAHGTLYAVYTMQRVIEWIRLTLGVSAETAEKLLLTALVLLALWVLHRILRRVLIPRIADLYRRYRVGKLSVYLIYLVGILLIGRIWVVSFQSIATFLGLLSAGIAIALREPLVNLAGWAFLVWRRPFEVGDRIEIGDRAGDVIDMRVFQFTLMEIGNWVDSDQSTGRIVHVPNGTVFTQPLANYSKGFKYIWNEIPVLVTFESDWSKAKEILLDIGNRHAAEISKPAERRLREAARKFMIFYTRLTPTVYLTVKNSGVMLTIRYLCEPRQRRGTEQAMWEEILNAFAQHDDIDFAYPTTRYFDNLTEGKPGLRPGDGTQSTR
jgi:small-conductance mechanosensitive channel